MGAARVIVTVCVLVVVPSCAVTATEMTVVPTARATSPLGVALVPAVPFTVNEAVLSASVAVTVVVAVALPTASA